jgi:hypothetical protein
MVLEVVWIQKAVSAVKPMIKLKLMQPISRQLIDKHVPMATNTHATIQLLLEAVFSTHSMQRCYKEDNWGDPVQLSFARKVKKRWCYISGQFSCGIFAG